MRANRIAAAALLALAAVTLPARAGLFDDQEARRRIDDLRKDLAKQGDDNTARIAKLEEQIRSIGVVELVRSIDELNQEIARLRGQIEVLQNDNQQLQKRQRDFYLDIDSRLKRLEGNPAGNTAGTAPADATAAGAAGTGSAAPGASSASAPGTAGTGGAATGATSGGAATGPGPTPPGSASAASSASDVALAKPSSREDQAREMKAYDTASNLFRRNDFAAAIESFREFLHDYPASALAPNANYWIGISYANMRDWKGALAAQKEVLAKYAQSPKAPDALLAIAAIHAEQGDTRGARSTYEDIIAHYPQSDAAGKARSRLASLRSR